MRHRRRIAVSLALLACASAIAGCLVDRSPLTAPPAPRFDAAGLDAATPDADVPPGADAWTEMPDAYVELPDAVDIPVDATQCDSVGDPCCGAGSCNGGLFCLTDGTCGTACGNGGQACCYMGVCFGSNGCDPTSGMCEACGGSGQVCCGVAPRCLAGLACDGTSCVPCGAIDQPCCAGSCTTGACDGTSCRPAPGTRGGPCRPSGMRCDMWAQCNFDGRCDGCGMRGETCCGTFECQAGLRCELFAGYECVM